MQRLALRVAKCREAFDSVKSYQLKCKQALHRQIIARDEMGMAVAVAYQKAEEERLDQMKTSLKYFICAEKERLKAAQKQLEMLELHVDSIDQAEDIQLIIHVRVFLSRYPGCK